MGGRGRAEREMKLIHAWWLALNMKRNTLMEYKTN